MVATALGIGTGFLASLLIPRFTDVPLYVLAMSTCGLISTFFYMSLLDGLGRKLGKNYKDLNDGVPDQSLLNSLMTCPAAQQHLRQCLTSPLPLLLMRDLTEAQAIRDAHQKEQSNALLRRRIETQRVAMHAALLTPSLVDG
jgi:hypothetical protein